MNIAAWVNSSGLTLLRCLRDVAALVSTDLVRNREADIKQQPGLVLFPKRIHELQSDESDSPDGLSLEYFGLAVRKNQVIWSKPGETASASLAADICREVSHAALLERLIVSRMNQ